jgi:hypothetical protein
MVKFFLGFLVGVGLALNIPVASAQRLERDKIMAYLAAKYNELPRSFMLLNEKQFLEIYVSEGGSWTIVSYDINDCGTPIANGSDYQDYDIHFGSDM